MTMHPVPESSTTWEHDRALVFSKLADLFDLTKEIRDDLKTRQAASEKSIIEIQRNCAVREISDVNLIQDVRRTEALAGMTSERLPDGLVKKVRSNTTKLYEHDALLTGLVRVNKGLLWIGGALGLSVIGLIWSLITGQATIIFGS